jgi:hypothetical protein
VTFIGVVVLDLFTLAVLLWLLDSVRRRRLYVGYGVILILVLLGVVATISVPPLRHVAEATFSRLFPAAPAAVVGFALIGLLLIYVLGQLTILSNRLAEVVQELALERVRREPPPKGDDHGSSPA